MSSDLHYFNNESFRIINSIYDELYLPILLLDNKQNIIYSNKCFTDSFNFNFDNGHFSKFLHFINELYFDDKAIKEIDKNFSKIINKKKDSYSFYLIFNELSCNISNSIIEDCFLVQISNSVNTFKIYEELVPIRLDENRFNIAEQNANIGFWEFDIESGIGWWSDNMFRLLGFEINSIPPAFDDYLENIHPDDKGIIQDALMKMSTAQLPHPLEYRTNPEKTKLRHLFPTYLIEYDENNNPKKYYGTVTDITERRKIEEKIKFQNEMLNRVAQSIIVTDNQGKIVIWNKFAETLYGWKEEEVIGKYVIDVTVPEESKQESDIILNELLNGKSWSGKFLLCNRDNKKFIGSVTDIPINDDNGNLIGVLGISYDISEQIKIERALEETERLFSIAFMHSPIAMMISTFDAIFVQVNNKFCELTDYSINELIGYKSPDLNIINLENRNQIISSLKNSPDKTYEGESIILTKEKKEKIVQFSIHQIEYKSKPHVLVSCIDITKRKEIENALQVSERQYRYLFENNPLPMWIFELQSFKIISVNNSAIVNYGYTREEFLNLTISDIRPKEDIERLKLHIGTNPSKYRNSGEWKHIKKNNEMIDVQIISSEVVYNGKIGRLVLAIDITERKSIENSLVQSEKKYRNLFETMVQGVVYQDERGNIISVNPAAEKILGLTYDQMIGKTSIDPDWKAIYEDGSDYPGDLHPAMLALNTGKTISNVVMGIYHPQLNDHKWLNVNAHPQFKPDDTKPYQVVTTFEDITERRKFELQLNESKKRLSYLLKLSPAIIYTLDPNDDFKITFISENIESVLGYKASDFIGEKNNWIQKVKEDDRLIVMNNLMKLSYSETLLHEYRISSRFNSFKWILDESMLIKDDKGEPKEIIGSWIDITDRKLNEEILSLERRFLDQIIENAPEGILITNKDEEIIRANNEFLKMFGYTIEEILHKTIFDIIVPEDIVNEVKLFASQVNSGNRINVESIRRTKDGKNLNFSVLVTPIFENGVLNAKLGIYRDISERISMQEQLFRSQRMESIGVLAGGIAHDLNNILGPILLSAQVLKLKTEDNKLKRLIETIESSAIRGKNIVSQVLTFARGSHTKPISLSLKNLVNEVVVIIKQTFPKNIYLKIDSHSNLWKIKADPNQIHQILINLAVNAKDAMPTGGYLNIAIQNVELNQNAVLPIPDIVPGKYVLIEISDTGVGIPPEISDKIFDPFFTTKEIGKGTGLGLSTVFMIVKQHNGFIHFESEINKGTSFYIYFPISNEQDINKKEASQNLINGDNRLFFVVDDEQPIQLACEEVLKQLGFRVILANNGSHAVNKFLTMKNEIEFVLIDMMMPVMDGITAANLMRNIKKDVVIIGMSGLYSESYNQDKISIIDAHIKKPFTTEALIEIINEAIINRSKKD